MTKTERSQIERATKMGRGALMRMLAILHRAGSTKTQREILQQIKDAGCEDEFIMRNGCLLHHSDA